MEKPTKDLKYFNFLKHLLRKSAPEKMFLIYFLFGVYDERRSMLKNIFNFYQNVSLES